MEHRDTPRMASAEGRPRDPSAVGRRFARFAALPTERRLVLGRLGLAALASVLALAAVVVVGSQALESMVRWLHGQPRYQMTFGAIALDPPPPPWYRGGRAVFLDRVRRAARREDAPFSALDIVLADVERAFRLYGWVERVTLVERKPLNRIIVHLRYRVPVAWAKVPLGNGRALLDRDGVLLPCEDVELEQAGPLIFIETKDLEPPFEPRYGQVWKTGEGPDGLGKADERVVAAAKLAAFLRSALAREGKPIPSVLQPRAIIPAEPEGLWLQNAEATFIYWARPPGSGTTGDLTDAERWTLFRQWLPQRPKVPVQGPNYLTITRDKGVEIGGGVRN